jgi:DNA-binding CsgD family transcriptional regulator
MNNKTMQLFYKGVAVRQIGRQLDISHKTVDYHLKKAGVK